MSNNTFEDQRAEFLEHFGVKGMRWGHRKGSDSVSPEKQAKRDQNAKKYEAKAAVAQARIDKIDSITPRNKQHARDLAEAKQLWTKDRDRALKDAEAKQQGKLSSTQKKVIIGASVTAAVVAAVAVYTNIESGEFTRLSAKGKAFMEGRKFEFKENPLLADKTLSADKVHDLVVKGVNPDYGELGTKMNCRRATFTYEMRRRGLDVTATKTNIAQGQTAVGLYNATTPGERIKSTGLIGTTKQIFKEQAKGGGKLTDLTKTSGGAQIKTASANVNGIIEALAGQPNGSRGELVVMWDAGGGHSMAYEIFNGKPVIFDAQSGAKLETVADMAGHGLNYIKSAGITRLDNIPLNTDYLMRWMTNVQ